jgi:hypothetical protein
MAINFIIIDFENEVSDEPEDILQYLGYIPEIAGKPDVTGLPLIWDLDFKFDFPIHGKLFRLLEPTVSVPYLTLVVEKAFKNVEQDSPEWIELMAKLSNIILFMNARFNHTLIPEDIDTHMADEGSIVYQFHVDLAPMEKDLIESRRGAFKLIKGE